MVDEGKHEQVIYSRLLDPANNVADRGMQSLDVTLPNPSSGGEIMFRTLPGPKDNSSFDWAYWGEIEFH